MLPVSGIETQERKELKLFLKIKF